MKRNNCKACGKLLPIQQGRGRQRQYCNDACQQDAYRERKGENRNSLLRNKSHLDLIFCAGDNREFFQVAYEAGYMLGIRSGRQSYGYDVQFVDIEYRRREFEKHLRVVARYQPKYATVLDLSEEEVSEQDIERAMKQHRRLSNYCQIPLIVPKLPGQIGMLPDHVAIGYSIPTSYGGAQYELGELQGRRIHLLGGSPHEQMDLYKRLDGWAQVMSVDGNMAMRIARDFSKYWQRGVWVDHPKKGTSGKLLYLDCWQRSCTNVRREWQRLTELSSVPPLQMTLESLVQTACDKEVGDALEIPA
ncbi:MAG TPA: DUF6610 family protein [Ktedonobacteraceae bacterium]|nr:DUF6610 family protein [Ktedonobacteraceae bacterium]